MRFFRARRPLLRIVLALTSALFTFLIIPLVRRVFRSAQPSSVKKESVVDAQATVVDDYHA